MIDAGRSDFRLTMLLAGMLVLLLPGCNGKPVESEAANPDSAVYPISDPLPPPPLPPQPPTNFDPSKSDAVAWLAELTGEHRGAASAKKAVEGLFQEHVERRASSGIPRKEAVAAYRRWLSLRLRRGLAAAAVQRDRTLAEHPGFKPQYVDGDYFSCLENGPTGFEVNQEAADENGRVVFDVRLWEIYQNETYECMERVVTVSEAGRWVVEDIISPEGSGNQPEYRLSELLPAEPAR